TALTNVIRQVKAQVGHTMPIIVEVDRLDQVDFVVAAQVTGILLDNFSTADLRTGVEHIADPCVGGAQDEVDLDTVADSAAPRLAIIAIGATPQGAAALDLGLDADYCCNKMQPLLPHCAKRPVTTC